MNKLCKQILLLLVILSIITTISCVSAVDDFNITVTSSDTFEVHISPECDDDSGDGSQKNPFKSLRYAIDYTSNDTTVYMNEGRYAGENNRTLHWTSQ